MHLKGSVSLVTGSSRGIGKAVALRLAQEGSSVVINASGSVREAKKTLSQLSTRAGQEHHLVMADIGKPGDIARLMANIKRRYNRLDLLVNNAGTTKFIDHRHLDRLTTEIFDTLYRVNLRGAFLCVQKAVPLLRRSPDPLVVNIASIAAMTAVGSNIAYCALKAGLVNMTMSLARALGPAIRVNAISPGLAETELTAGWRSYRAAQIKKTPLGRLATGDDIANAVVALAGSLTYVTGQNIVVDGGRVLH